MQRWLLQSSFFHRSILLRLLANNSKREHEHLMTIGLSVLAYSVSVCTPFLPSENLTFSKRLLPTDIVKQKQFQLDLWAQLRIELTTQNF